jgi:surface polysaccharide O-acyltransferase-like enzyme
MLGADVSLKKLYTVKIPRLLIAFLFWSLVYALIGGGLKNVLLNVVCGKYHLWFIYLTLGLYTCIPVIRKIVEDQRITVYFLAVSLVVAFAMPLCLRILADFGGEAAQTWAKALKAVYSDLNITVVCGYAVYFVAGHYLNRTEIDKPLRMVIYGMGILGTIVTLLLTLRVSVAQGAPVGNYYEYLNLNIYMQSAAVFVWVKYNTPSGEKFRNLTKKLSAYSFGIYLVHIMILEALDERLGVNTLSFNPVLAVPVIAVAVLAVSWVMIAVIRKIPVLKDYII